MNQQKPVNFNKEVELIEQEHCKSEVTIQISFSWPEILAQFILQDHAKIKHLIYNNIKYTIIKFQHYENNISQAKITNYKKL